MILGALIVGLACFAPISIFTISTALRGSFWFPPELSELLWIASSLSVPTIALYWIWVILRHDGSVAHTEPSQNGVGAERRR